MPKDKHKKTPASSSSLPARVGILVGSANDLTKVEPMLKTFEELKVTVECRVLSAHRTPEATIAYVRSAAERGISVIVACAGLAAHLAGTAASHTVLPVIGVPLSGGSLQGLDALLSTVQMPSGVPVATVGIDCVTNAAFLAARILALDDEKIRQSLLEAADKKKRAYPDAG